VTQGYYRNEEATRQTFVRRGDRVTLRTGDLGFEYQGQLFITGRHKDLIIVRGHNLYPQDLERTVEDSVEVVRKGRVLAFSAEIGAEERIIVAAEVSQRVQKLVEPGALCSAIGEAVARLHGEAVAVVLLVNPGGIPITSSGKLQRAMCRKLWQKKTLDTFARHEAGALVLGSLGQPNTVNA
jgi:acyl-CoA synthetase (AMP-forming)/AMP-acid ligase II